MPSIKDKLFEMVSGFFHNQIELIKYKEQIAAKLNQDNRKREAEISELSMYLQKPVICISNEWDTPIIGFVTQIGSVSKAENPALIVRNYLDGQEYLVLGKTFYYTDQRFNALFKLDPFEWCAFLFGRYCDEDYDKEKSGEVLDKEKVIQLLEVNGFFEKLKTYRECQQAISTILKFEENRNPRNTAHQDAVT